MQLSFKLWSHTQYTGNLISALNTNDTARSTDYLALQVRQLVNNEFERKLKEAVMA